MNENFFISGNSVKATGRKLRIGVIARDKITKQGGRIKAHSY